jgi:uncharacterized membrane protein
MQRERLPYLLIPLAAFVVILPLLLHGCSCGHDFDFHILSWFEAARQFTRGNLHPHWAYTPAWNAGEPRFVFYPPLSWTIGAIVGLLFPWTSAPILYIWLALTASGLALHRLARAYTTGTAAVIAATLYTANPYMLFTAYERSAYAELLAAAFIPLLLHAILRDNVTIPRIAIPIALLWLTNAPAAVMSCYALALLTLIRLVYPSSSPNPPAQTRLQVALNVVFGTVLGLGIAAFYILPAAYERRYVQIAMAIIPNMRIQDNFLFHHTGDIPHDQVLHTASLIAVLLIALTAIVIFLISVMQRDSAVKFEKSNIKFLRPLSSLTIAIALLLTPLTALLWNHIPELVFLQFPWRLVAILAAILAFTIALSLSRLNLKPTSTAAVVVLTAILFTYPAYALFHQACDQDDTVEARVALFNANKGTDPTDEYTPTTADNDSLAQTNPPYWLATDLNAKAPTNVQPGPAPTHLSFQTSEPGSLILNLRDYPSWRIALNGLPIIDRNPESQRDDGLIALSVPAGPSTIDISYSQTLDQTLGDAISVSSLVLLVLFVRRDYRRFHAT